MNLQINKIAEFGAHAAGVYALANAQNEFEFFSGSSDKFVTKWDLKTLENTHFAAQLPSFVYAVALVPNKNVLLVGTFKGAIHVIDLAEKNEIKVLQNHNAAIFDLCYSTKHNLVFCSGGDGSISVVNTSDFSVLKIISLCTQKIRRLSINKNQTLLSIACGDGKVRLLDIATLQIIKEIDTHLESANVAVFHPTKPLLISGGKDAHLRFWDLEKNYELVHHVAAHNWAVYDIVFSNDAKYFATASRDKTIKIWDATTNELLYRINKEKNEGHTHSVNKLLWTNHNNYLVSAGDDRKVMVWDIV